MYVLPTSDVSGRQKSGSGFEKNFGFGSDFDFFRVLVANVEFRD